MTLSNKEVKIMMSWLEDVIIVITEVIDEIVEDDFGL